METCIATDHVTHPPHSPSTKTQPLLLFQNQQPRSLCAAESYVSLKLLHVNNISTELQEKASNLARLVNTVIHHDENTKDPPDELQFSSCFSFLIITFSIHSSHSLSPSPPLLTLSSSPPLCSSPLTAIPLKHIFPFFSSCSLSTHQKSMLFFICAL